MRNAYWLLLVACLALGTIAFAQQSPQTALARREDNILRVRNAPTVLMWARGLADAADLDTYVASGFNTAYVLIAEPSEAGLQKVSDLMSAAEGKGLFVIAAITPAAVRDAQGNEIPSDPTSEDYSAAITGLAGKLGDIAKHPNLIGWSVEAVPPSGFPWSDAAFQAYLANWYGNSTPSLNSSWGANFTGWDQVTMSGARDADASKAGGLGRASVDLALYRQDAYADALDLWAKALRAADTGHLLFASALPDYRSIISVRTTFDGLITNTYPTVAEQDFVTHNVQAIDIARRANQFAVIPTFLVNSNADPNRTANWMNDALLHGATGLALSSWSVVKDSEDLQGAVKQTADAIRDTGYFPAKPSARAAILYEPIAGGATRDARGLYGYLDGVTPGEPTTLFSVARGGTRYGQMDVLALSSIGQTNLQQYGAIFAPEVLYLPEEDQVALNDFVLRGGALLVDAGIGMYQGDGTVESVPPVVMEMLGMRYTELAEQAQPGPYGSLGQPGQEGQPGIAIPVGPGEAGLTMDPDVAKFADILGQFLSRPDVRKYLGEEFVGESGPGFRVRGLGNGFAVYAPTFLYQSWSPEEAFFNEFHQRMLSWRYDLEVIQPDALWPSVGAAIFANRWVGVASPDGTAAIVDVYGGQNQMYFLPLGASRYANPQQQNRVELLFAGTPLAVARPVPIYLTTSDQDAVVTATLSQYDAQGIELLVNGNGAQANVTRNGVSVTGGVATDVEIDIYNGLYRVAAGSEHRVTIQQGPKGRETEMVLMPNPDTGALTITGSFFSTRITVQPVPAQ